uniref:Uncharacterized protein n=1 Tax=Haptolina ericina TaxID=156174 RepID=A0A7S3AUJ0_9EUKA
MAYLDDAPIILLQPFEVRASRHKSPARADAVLKNEYASAVRLEEVMKQCRDPERVARLAALATCNEVHLLFTACEVFVYDTRSNWFLISTAYAQMHPRLALLQ